MIKIILIIILFQIKKNGQTFEIDWSYKDFLHSSLGLNTEECGLSSEPIIYKLPLEGKCFANKYENKKVITFDLDPKAKNIPQQRINKGSNAVMGEAPFAVHIRLHHYQIPPFLEPPLTSSHKCTGTLITLKWVLTVASCFDYWESYPWDVPTSNKATIKAGGNTLKGTDSREMSKYFIHPIYKDPWINLTAGRKASLQKKMHDIALIKLDSSFKRKVTQNNKYSISTVCLPKHESVPTIDSNIATFFGFGEINFKQRLPSILQKGPITLDNIEHCVEFSFCGSVSKDGPKVCKGDIGGPLVQNIQKYHYSGRALLIGITRGFMKKSWDESENFCDDTVIAGNFTSVVSHIPWIIEIIKNN